MASSCFPDAFTSLTLGSPGHRMSASTNGGSLAVFGGDGASSGGGGCGDNRFLL